MTTKGKKGYFGEYGGSFVPQALQIRLDELEKAYDEAKSDPSFKEEFMSLLKEYVGRPSALTECKNISHYFGGGRLFLKREDLNHTGAHKINNAIGQALLAKRMGKTELIAETGAGMHGTASATVAALMGMKCTVYMGALDVARQAPNVARMKVLGTEVIAVEDGQKALKEAVDAALKAFAENPETFYLLGSAVGPHPYPTIVRDFQSIIGKEARSQFIEREQNLPDYAVACVGGGSNAIGLFAGFLNDREVKIVGVEPAGKGLATGEHAATLSAGHPSVIHGFKSYVLSDDQGEPAEVYSISAGLDYPGVGPEHAYLKDSGRVSYTSVTDQEAINAFKLLSRKEGIIPALESSHALAYAFKLLPTLSKNQTVLVNLSGRGDKDMDTILPLIE
ncbi:tryptophan synthase subunit beta [Aminobacterium sp. MB27-C1]|jgi:tryptophan synthase beta chain|uniref:tryptophan synthase subunit beta n=1 Tax=Aminobacterium sp. MB27-C1 TaxID=3070661 RepID=UPI001BCEB778|nr:tryptophan synthase subunit beta [Aminobacterium sp. MB27-C1]WMI70762.1 tryptophan synthase subunit beta [Aminobacterium sp. MB27-C1]